MNRPGSQERLPDEQLDALCSESETAIDTLRRQVEDLEAERDQALNGLDVITQGLRRRGCCDSHHTAR